MPGDMRFVGIFTVIYGAMICLGIITAVIGVPLLLAGLKLREAADQLERYASSRDPYALAAAFERQGSYFRTIKIIIIVGLVLTALYLVFIMLFFGAIFGGMMSGFENLPQQ
jgi:hypothetical protein